jgi:hypothetical protein
MSPSLFPKVFAWVERFDQTVSTRFKAQARPKTLKGPEAMRQITSSEYAEPEGRIEANDPSGLKKGQEIELWPVDSGFRNKDRGTLISLSDDEVVIETRTDEGKTLRVHAPRHGFRFKPVGAKL